MSGGYCPSFSSKLKGENLMLAGDSVLVTKDFEHVGRYDDLNTGEWALQDFVFRRWLEMWLLTCWNVRQGVTGMGC
jgi:hypothetical protein